MRTCVTPQGRFRYLVHQPSYRVHNLRQRDHLLTLGRTLEGDSVLNRVNFPAHDPQVERASTVYEIPNPFPFRGSTFIDSSWAGPKAEDPTSIRIISGEEVSLSRSLSLWAQKEDLPWEKTRSLLQTLPDPVLLALATTSTDREDLILLARISCEFASLPEKGKPGELAYTGQDTDNLRPVIHDRDLFEAVANNPCLPEEYKEAMVLRPGVQGSSEIVADYVEAGGDTHIFEYLRRNSYIPWGHYAANMAHDAVRYRARDLDLSDMRGLRHLYYQRIYVRLAAEMGLDFPRSSMSDDDLEHLRLRILDCMKQEGRQPEFTCSLWGWNFGFDFAPTRYRLHASHQQIHQQNAMVPDRAQVMVNGSPAGEEERAFASGDMVAEVVRQYYRETGQDFFEDLIRCVRNNRRTDGGKGEQELIVHEDAKVLLFVPKAQLSQWELQLMPLERVGNVLEADEACRQSLDRAMLLALHALEAMGASMVTTIEYSKRFNNPEGSQRLLYSFLPRLPWSPGSFSEAQNRYINGHFPEDFAAACRSKLREVASNPH